MSVLTAEGVNPHSFADGEHVVQCRSRSQEDVEEEIVPGFGNVIWVVCHCHS